MEKMGRICRILLSEENRVHKEGIFPTTEGRGHRNMDNQLLNTEELEKVLLNPKYQELVSKRNRLGWTLAIIMLVIYYGFIMVLAFSPASLGIPIAEGSVITVGIPIGVTIIVSAFILTGIYVRRANSEFDDLTRQIKEDVR